MPNFNVNAWFCDLEQNRQAVLREDKWMLAEAVAKAAWNAAIDAADAAIESSDHNADDSGLSANCNAMIAVERLKA